MSILGYAITNNLYPFTSTATSTQTKSLETLKKLTEGSNIVANNYVYLDLYLQGKSKINWYQKVESDPAVRQSGGQVTHILTDFQFDDELTGHHLSYLESLLKSQKPTTKFGILPAPGENIKPYTNEFLSLYTLHTDNKLVRSILTLPQIDQDTLTNLVNTSPYAILITHDNFTSSSDLQDKINLIKTTLPTTEIVVSQDSEGHNTIPWVSTNARSFFKSTSEALEATSRKITALKALGFTGAIVASSQDQDGYLQAIIESSAPTLTLYVLYTGNIPTFYTNLIVENNTYLEAIKKAGYPGNLFLISQPQ